MNEQSFVEKRDIDWKRLDELTNKARGSKIETLSEGEIVELLKLYRRTSTDLAIARTKSRNPVLVDYLNGLLATSYTLLYRAPRNGLWGSIMAAIATAAQTVRARKAFVWTSAAIFFVSWLFVFIACQTTPDALTAVVGPNGSELFEHWKHGEFEERSALDASAMAGFYASNNPRVAILQGAVGASTFGVASVFLLFQNGALIGALSSEMFNVGRLGFLLSSITPHGVPELSGAIISGAAGLLFGWALICPGRKKRSDALRAVGRDGMVLILTSVTLMFIAAPIEAYFSFNPAVPPLLKVAVAVVGFCVWMLFWSFYGKKEPGPAPVYEEGP